MKAGVFAKAPSQESPSLEQSTSSALAPFLKNIKHVLGMPDQGNIEVLARCIELNHGDCQLAAVRARCDPHYYHADRKRSANH